MTAIQILLADDANRQALASLVSERYTPLTASELQDAELYLVDDATLPQYQEALVAHKREQAPVFCPVILLRRDRTSITIDLPDPDPNERPLLINDVVTAPVEKEVLFRRIANLIVRRRQTTELQEANNRLEQFASTLRHELRNPLNILDGYLKIARDQGDAEAFERCQRAIDQMARLLEETLLILQGDDADIEKQPVDLAQVCAECWEMVPESEAQVELATTQWIYADKDRLAQMLGNLFRNAVEHGGGEVTVKEIDGGFSIEDNGLGIPEDERELVFEEGYSTSGAGTGLGLAVVSAVATAHGWDIRVTEGTAGGARFEVTGVERAEETAD